MASTGRPERPTWFSGPLEKFEVLNRISARRGIQLDPTTPPSESEAEELVDALSDELLVAGFDRDYNPTPLGAIIESLIDSLAEYYDTD